MRIVRSKKIEESQPSEDEADAQLLDPEAVSRLFHEHNRTLVGYLTARLRSNTEAREVAQEAYVRLLQLHKQGTPNLFTAWLFKTATNLAIDRLRRRAFRSRESDLFQSLNETPDSSLDPENLAIADEQTRRLLEFVSELPQKHQQIFRLHCLDELDQRDVARKFGVSDRMVRRYVTYTLMYCRLRMNGLSIESACCEITL